MENMVNVKINGKEYAVPANSTVLEAARYAGIDIPTLCYLKDINEIGACRLCLVDTKVSDNKARQVFCVDFSDGSTNASGRCDGNVCVGGEAYIENIKGFPVFLQSYPGTYATFRHFINNSTRLEHKGFVVKNIFRNIEGSHALGDLSEL